MIKTKKFVLSLVLEIYLKFVSWNSVFAKNLFFRFFVRCMLIAPLAIFLELQLPIHCFSILVRVIIHVFTHGTSQADYVFGKFSLCHSYSFWLLAGNG